MDTDGEKNNTSSHPSNLSAAIFTGIKIWGRSLNNIANRAETHHDTNASPST